MIQENSAGEANVVRVLGVPLRGQRFRGEAKGCIIDAMRTAAPVLAP